MENFDKRPIGIFDSGVGGLTVVKEVINAMPNENIIYFGDTARVPYGSKSKETVFNFSCQIIRFLKKQNVKAIIIACNTVSSNCYDDLKSEFPGIPIVEVVNAGVNSAIKTTKSYKIGVIGTQATIKSNQYTLKIKEKFPNIEVFSKACPLFVPLAEEGWFDNDITIDIANVYLQELIKNDIDTLILGCTHYPLLQPSIKKVIGEKINIVNPAFETALNMKKLLIQNNIQNDSGNKHSFFVSDESEKFNFICSLLLNKTYCAKKINVEKY